MPEFEDKDKVKTYSEDLIPTTAINDFIDKDTIKRVLEYYDNIDKAMSEVMRFGVRISELDFYPQPDEPVINFLRYDGKADQFKTGTWEYDKVIQSVDNSVIKELPDIVMTGLEKHGHKNLKFRQMALHNLDSFLPVHCDGNNIKNRHAGRPIPTDPAEYLDEKYIKRPQQQICSFQGMITLDVDDVYGTAVFDQWFPWSVYYMPNYTTATMPRAKKSRITFLEGDGIERFGEYIRNHTGEKFSEESFIKMRDLIKRMKINEAPGQTPLLDQLSIKAFWGLSLEGIAEFGDPGKLNLWDNKRFHMTMPWLPRYETSRKLIQFETAYK